MVQHRTLLQKRFFRFDDCNPKNHATELPDGSRATGVTQYKGDTHIKLHGKKGRLCNKTLKDALCVPSYK